MTSPAEKPLAGPPTADEVEKDTLIKLGKAKLEAFMKMSPSEMIQSYFKEREKLDRTGRREMLKAMFFAYIFGKLGIKPKTEEEGVETQEEAQAIAEEMDEVENLEPNSSEPASPDKTKDQKPTPILPVIDKQEFKTGDLLAAIGKIPGVEVQGGLQKLETRKLTGKGVPNWKKDDTDGWNINSDEDIQNGDYKVESAAEPSGYVRSGTEKPPGTTIAKLVTIANLLRSDKRMPLFYGIAMKVDGVEVMMVKEIHIHSMSKYKIGGLADHYYQPHTGVSYIMKKTK